MSDRSAPGPYGKPCEDWADLIVEHALRPESRPEPALGEHLQGCRDCDAYLRWLMPATGVLAESVPGVAPPPGLKSRVMSEVRADAERRGSPATPSPRRRLPLLRFGLAGLAAASLIAGAVVAIDPGASDDSRVYGLSMATGGAAGELIADGDSAALHLSGIEQPPDGRVYQAWLRDGQRLEPSTVFAVSRTGEAEAAIPRGVEGAEELLVTIEPQGGSAQPSTRPRLAVSLD